LASSFRWTGSRTSTSRSLCADELDPEMDSAPAQHVLERLAEALAESTATTVVISNENLARASAEQAARLWELLRAAMPGAESHLVITARDLARQVPAAWQQQIQQRHMISWPDFLRSMRDGTKLAAYFLAAQDASDVALRWAGDLPADRVHVVTVPRPGAPKSALLERFCGVLGIDLAAVASTVPVANESLGRTPLELLRRVIVDLGERLPHPRAGFGRVGKRYFAHEVLAPMGADRLVLPAEMAPWCEEQTERLVQQISAAGYEVVGDLEELRPDLSGLETAPAEVTDSEIAAAAVAALADVLDQRNRDLEEIDRLRERVRELRGRSRRRR